MDYVIENDVPVSNLMRNKLSLFMVNLKVGQSFVATGSTREQVNAALSSCKKTLHPRKFVSRTEGLEYRIWRIK
jgi:hypothetical protein